MRFCQVAGSGTFEARCALITVVGLDRLFWRHSRTVGWSFLPVANAQLPIQSEVNGVVGWVTKLNFFDSQNWWNRRVAVS